MDTGFGINLEGFLVKGNLSLAPSLIPLHQGDGSLEGSGTLYFNIIKEYTDNLGVDLQNVLFQNNLVHITHTQPSCNETSASLIVEGGALIKSVVNSTSPTCGGGLTVNGGAAIAKNAHIGGTVYMNDNNIKNVKYPVDPKDAATKEYVDNQSVSGNFTTGQVIIADSVGKDIRGFDNFTFNGIALSINSTENIAGSLGGSFVCFGGVSISKDVFVGGTLNVNSNVIKNVANPIDDQDAATKYYVDNKTYGNLLGSVGNTQIVTGSTDPNKITSHPAFTINNNVLQVGTAGLFYIANTAGALSINDTTASLFIAGGAVVQKELYIGGTVDVGGNNITNVADPINMYDAVNKKYVDDRKLQGLFTTGQLIIANSDGDSIRGFDNLSFSTINGTLGTLLLNQYTDVILQNTSNASGLGVGGGLTSLGGATFYKNVYIGGQLDVGLNRITSVADPIEDYDAVNKRYVTSLLDASVGGDNSLILNNNTTVPVNIEALTFDPSVKAFLVYIYINNNYEKSAVYTIRGVNTGTNWYIVNTYTGEPTLVNFYITTDTDNKGILQYTNLNISGFTSVQYRIVTQLFENQSGAQTNFTLQSNTNNYTDITDLSFGNLQVDGAKIVTHVSDTSEVHGMIFLNVLQKNGSWVLNKTSIGDIPEDLDFRIYSDGIRGVVQYKNPNASNYTLRFNKFQIAHVQPPYTFNANTLTPTATTITDFLFQKTQTNFNLTIYAYNTTLNKHALYEIEAQNRHDSWKVNSRFIGDPMDIYFTIHSTEENNLLKYTNKSANDVLIKYYLDAPTTFQPLPVTKGGTGRTYLTPFAVLRGNGTDAIVSSSDFIYKDRVLILGPESSIYLKNTQSAIGLGSGGSLTVLGGAAISKNLIVGGVIDVKENNIINVKDPVNALDAANKNYVDKLVNSILSTANTFVLNNLVAEPEDIPDFNFSSDTKAFVAYIYVQNQSGNGDNCAMFCLRGIKRQSNWFLSKTFIGDPTNIQFFIRESNGGGQIQYTNSNGSGVTTVRFKVMTQIKDTPEDDQINLGISNNVNTFTDIPELTMANSILDSAQYVIYVSNDTEGRYGMYILNCVLKGSNWVLNTYSTGNVQGLSFRIESTGTDGRIQYTNTNSNGNYTFRIQSTKILKSDAAITLHASTTTPTTIDNTFLAFDKGQYIFHVIAYVEVPALNLHALYEIEGLFCDGEWSLNSHYVGDRTGVHFSIQTSTYGFLQYTNTNNVDAIIKYVVDAPLIVPLSVKKGGTGKTFLRPNAVLRGNGIDPIIATDDFTYENNVCKLGPSSSILIQNTTDVSSGTTGGTFTTYGGAVVGKTLVVGDKLRVNDIDITPNVGDINQKEFFANNNQITPSNVVGFDFTNPQVKSFTGVVCVTIETTDDTFDSLYEVKGLNKKAGWIIRTSYIGDDIGIDFTITSSGQVQYQSPNIADWISTSMKFRAMTTTI
jgi:hypothetical protein